MESWKTIPGWPWYEISDKGNVRVSATRKLMKPRKYRDTGYLCVGLFNRDTKKYSNRAIHSLVLHAFVGPKPTELHETSHEDNCRTNNSLDNLSWATRQENAKHRVASGNHVNTKGSKNGRAKLTEEVVAAIKQRLSIGESNKHIAYTVGVSSPLISMIRNKRIWRHVT